MCFYNELAVVDQLRRLANAIEDVQLNYEKISCEAHIAKLEALERNLINVANQLLGVVHLKQVPLSELFNDTSAMLLEGTKPVVYYLVDCVDKDALAHSTMIEEPLKQDDDITFEETHFSEVK